MKFVLLDAGLVGLVATCLPLLSGNRLQQLLPLQRPGHQQALVADVRGVRLRPQTC